MLDSRCVLTGLGRAAPRGLVLPASRRSRFGRPPSKDGREDDECRMCMDCDCGVADGAREPVTPDRVEDVGSAREDGTPAESACRGRLDALWRSSDGKRYMGYGGAACLSRGGVVLVPVDTIEGRSGTGWYAGCATCVEIAFSSGVLEIIAEARLISPCFGGADADFRGGVTRCDSDEALGLLASVACLWLAVGGVGEGDGRIWKASSASFSARRCDASFVWV